MRSGWGRGLIIVRFSFSSSNLWVWYFSSRYEGTPLTVIDLDMLGVHASYQGKGLGSRLLKWGLTRADAEGLEVYLSASPAGKPLYQKYGFREVDSFSPYPDYAQVAMIRSPNSQI